MLALTFMLLLVVELGWAAQCNKWSGPAGTVECIQLRSYNNEYQWGTCVTDTYMKQKSDQKHQCIDRAATYCCYQCMLEVHNKDYGSVTSDCSCTPSNPTSHPNITTLLPPECYSPSGDSCDWYRNCLERSRGIPVKLQVMDMQSNTPNIFASCMTKTLESSVKPGKTGLMEFANASKSH